jgi:iron complex outermembrane receptor protein
VLPFVFRNGLEGDGYGVEVSADARPTDWWRLSAAYSYLRLELQAASGSTDTSGQAAEGASPRSQVFLRSAMDLPRDLNLDAMFRHVAQLPAQQVPSYTTLDARLAWQPTPRIEVAAVGQNLLTDHHVEFGGNAPSRVEVERGAFLLVTLRW